MKIVKNRYFAYNSLNIDKWSPKSQLRIRLFPMTIVQIYLLVILALFAFGPWPWPVKNELTLYSFLIFAQLSLFLGYVLSFNKRPHVYKETLSWRFLFKWSLVLNIIWIIPNYLIRRGEVAFDPSQVMDNILYGLNDPGGAYKEKIGRMALNATSIWGYATLLVSPFLAFMMPLGIIYWGKLKIFAKFLFLFCVFCEVLTWMIVGSNKGLVDLMLTIPFLIIIGRPSLILSFNKKKVVMLFLIQILFFYLFILMFSASQLGRAGGKSIPSYDHSTGIHTDVENIFLVLLPENTRPGFSALISYLTQGYYALSLALEEPFVWTYGFGHGYYTASWYNKFFPYERQLAPKTYPGRIVKHGWSYWARWHSIYPWLASDLTFFGTIIAVFFIGRLFSLVWQDILYSRNPVALALFTSLIVMLFYFPGNNQVLGFPRGASAFWSLLIWWIITRKKRIIGVVEPE